MSGFPLEAETTIKTTTTTNTTRLPGHPGRSLSWLCYSWFRLSTCCSSCRGGEAGGSSETLSGLVLVFWSLHPGRERSLGKTTASFCLELEPLCQFILGKFSHCLPLSCMSDKFGITLPRQPSSQP